MMDIALLQRQGLKPEDMIEYFSAPLNLAQVHGALTYYYDHPESAVEIERPPFGGDKDRRIDQRPHGDRGRRPWLRAARRTSEA